MVAADGQDCLFYAIVLRPQEPSLPEAGGDRAAMIETAQSPDPEARIYTRFVDAPEDANGKLQSIAFKNEQSFNFAFDIVDALGREKPEKLAILHVALDGTERRFTFKDMKDASSQAANYFTSLGIRRGDRVMLEELVQNLCDNAIKYNADGGSVDVRVGAEGGSACLTVRDTGIGIPPEHQSRIFERFYRVDKMRSRAAGGTGLGLSIVADTVRRRGGSIAVSARAGGGTCFTVRLPAVRREGET